MSWWKKSAAPHRAINWKSNLAALWVSQFLSLSGFYFCLPFLPLHLKENKIVPPAEVAFWSGVFISAAPVAMMIMSPIWGTLGDRFGRKMMLVRATLSGAFVLYLMGVVDSIEALIVLRVLQGAFTGTIQTAQTLVTAHTPDRSQGFAIGVLMAAVNAGNTAGPFFGGVCAMYFGAASTFKAGGIMLFLSTILVITMVRENFIRPERLPVASRSVRRRRRRESITSFKSGIPLLLAVGVVAFMQTYDGPFLSLYIDWLFRSGTAAASGLSEASIVGEVYGITGWVSAAAGLAAVAGSITVGLILDRNVPRWIWLAISVAGTLGAYWISRNPSLFGLVTGRSFFLFFISGLASALIVLLSRMTPSAKHGTALGWAVTTRSIGWAVAPICGALAADRLGFSPAYVIMTLFSLLLLPVFIYLTGRYRRSFQPMAEAAPAPGSSDKKHS